MPAESPLRAQILGPLRLWIGGVERDAGPRQQVRLLALLLARAGQPVSTTELVDLLWDGDAPASAVNVVHRYVGALRRLLEPGLPARGTGSYLVRQDQGYRFTPGPGRLDLVEFREWVDAARAALAEQHLDAALDNYVRALGLWHGPAADGLSYGATASPIFDALNAEWCDACVAAAELAVSLGRSEYLLQPIRLAASRWPLHEAVQAALVSVETTSASPTVAAADGGEPAGAGGRVVGRLAELATLRQAVSSAVDGGTGIVLLEGEPGVGKTRLLEETDRDADRRGLLVVWGRCREADGAPAMWPWLQAIGALLDSRPVPERERLLAGELGRLVERRGAEVPETTPLVEGSQFRFFQQVVHAVGQATAARPVLIVIDDLQWADVASLQLFGHLVERLPPGTAIVGALRDHAPAPAAELTRMLAAASRVPGHRRIRLGPLNPDEVAELVRREIGQDPEAAVARSIHARTAGNPFFVQELARLLRDGGVFTPEALVQAGVPSTVRDVVRDRMAGLDDVTRDLLRIAAVVGRDVDLRLLARVAGLDVQTCLVALEPVHALGLLVLVPDDPFSVRFTHDLVRESVARDAPPTRSPRLHLLVADVLEEADLGGESSVERRAHHLWAAGPLADPARTAAALILAGRRTAARYALEPAERLLRSAAQVARDAGLAEPELSALSELMAVVGMRAGYHASAFEVLERAERVARDLGREREATDFLFSRRAAYSQSARLDRSGPLARRLLEQGEASPDPVVQAYGLHSWGIHQWDVGNVGDAFRYLGRVDRALFDNLAPREERPLRYDLQLMSAGMLAEVTALHGDVDSARTLLDTMETAAGEDSYAITVWASFAARIAALAGEPIWALRVAKQGIAEDPDFSYRFFGAYLRLANCWARAVTGQEPAAAAAEAEQIITAVLLDPPRSNVPTWCGLLAEAWLAAGRPVQAGAALDRADHFLDSTGQRYAEGLLLLLRARLLRARGEKAPEFRAVAERARSLSTEREAHLFARRAEEFLASPEAQ